MNRLRHGVKAYLMTFRMTRAATVLFVEGKDNDPFFYQQIADRYAREMSRDVEIRQANELPNAASMGAGGAGGKQALARAALFVSRWRSHQSIGLQEGREIAFCVDKDIDDIEGKRLALNCLVYTPLHSCENHLIASSDVKKSLCFALSASAQTLDNQFARYESLREMARRWREWVICCVLAQRLGIERYSTYSRPSPLNKPAHALSDQALFENELSILARLSNIPKSDFDLSLKDISELVDDRIVKDQFDELFKGKWYCDILFSLVQSCPDLVSRCKAGKSGLWIGIRATFLLSDRDYRYYKAAIQRAR